MSHGDLVTEIAPGFEKVGTSNDCPIASIEDANRKFYGVQFHPEVRHSEYGNDLLRHFAFDVCGCTGDWSMENFIDMEVAKIREQVGDKKSYLVYQVALTQVLSACFTKAIGDQLTCIFVDHGLLRKGEAEQVMESLGGKFGLNIIKVDAKERFLSKLAGVSDPEQKRKIIGNEFVYVLMTKQLNLLGKKAFHS